MDGSETILTLGDLPRLIRVGAERPDKLVVAGAADAELGQCLVPVAAAAVRPRSVLLVDTETKTVRSSSLGVFLFRSAPRALLEITSSAAAIGLQRAAVPLVRRGASSRSSGQLRRMLYIRVTAGSTTGVGGAATHTHEVIRALTEAGVAVEPLTNDRGIAEAAEADPRRPCSWRLTEAGRTTNALPASAAFGADVTVVRAGARAAKQADVVYQRHGRFTLAGAMLARLTGTPLFLEFNGSESYFHDHWQSTPLARQLALCEEAALAAATRVFVVSDVDRGNLLRRGVDPSRVIVNPNGVDARRFDVGGGAAARAALGIPHDAIVVGFVGSFGPWHGAPVLARAFATAARTRPDLWLLLVGDGPQREDTEREIARDGYGDRSVFAGSIPSHDVPAHLDACDVLAAPHVPLPDGAEFFGSPTKLFEYMAAGKAIAASALGQIASVLDDERTAILSEPGDESALADAIGRLADDPTLRARLGAAARRTAMERHGWDRNARRVIEAYESASAAT